MTPQHAGRLDERAMRHTHPRAPEPDAKAGSRVVPAGSQGADPRLAHAGTAAPGLMALQRSAGNAAVASLVAGRATVQRAPVQIEEVSGRVSAADPSSPLSPAVAGAVSGAVHDAAAAAGGGAANPVSSDGATTTVTGSAIHLAAPMTQADGVLRVDTLVADSVVASSYTPGAGNVW